MRADDLVTAAEAARLTGRSVSTIRYWAWCGKLVAVERHTLRHWHYYRLGDVLRLHNGARTWQRGWEPSPDEIAAAAARERARRVGA